MKKTLVYLSVLGMVLGVMAFQCASAELTGAKLYINQKQWAKAKEALQKEVAKNPKSDEGWYLLGYLYGEEDNFTEMLSAFDKSLEASKKFEPQITESKKYYWATNFNKGVSFFNNATKVTSKDSMNMFFEKAVESFKNAILCQPDSVVTYTNLVYAYINLGKIDEAIEPLQALVKEGTSSEGFTMLGQIYMDKGNVLMDQYATSKNLQDSLKALEFFNQAVEVLETGKAKFPDDGEVLLRLSNAYIAANKLDVAINAFREGVIREPENKFYHYNYGVLLLNSKNFAEAETEFKKAIEIDPEYINAIYNLGVTYVRWGTDIREKAEAEEKTDETYKDKFRAALPLMEKYLEKNPEEPAIWELMGKIYANLGMQDKSNDAFLKADQYRK